MLLAFVAFMSSAQRRLYLIDGSSYIYRAFFALPPLTSPSGLPTNAVYGFTTMFLRFLEESRPEFVAVVFDAPGPTFRDDLFAEYKANRPPAPDDLVVQFEHVRRVVAALDVGMLSEVGVEADDVIATLVTKLASEDLECVIITGDKDLMQLVGPRVRLWDTMRDRWFDAAAVRERLGVRPGQVVDFMALVGDSVDNVPGVKGIGAKTAAALISEFGDLEGVLSHLSDVAQMKLRGAKRIAERLREATDIARLSYQLVELKRDVALECRLEDLRFEGADFAALRDLCGELGFQSLARRLSSRAQMPEAVAPLVTDASEAAERLRHAFADGWMSAATLGDAGPPVTTPARELFVCGADDSVFRVPLDCDATRRLAAAALSDASRLLVAYDLKRDLLQLAAAGIEVGCRAVDVMVAAHLVDAGGPRDLQGLAERELGVRAKNFRGDVAGTAAGVRLLSRLWRHCEEQLGELGVRQLFDEVEMPLVRVLMRMERRGVRVDVGLLAEMGREIGLRLDDLIREIYALAGAEFNINSPPQLREILFERIHLPTQGVRRGKTGYSTDVEVLRRLAAEHPLPGKILEYRALAKLQSTYVDALPAAVNPQTGRLHTSFNQTATATGRLSSSNPNLQNIPIRGTEGRRMRAAFVAAPDQVLLAADYSQIELRILAHLSQDQSLLEAFRADEDVHVRTAAEVFDVPVDGVTAAMRRAAKVINFGIIYGMGPQRLAHELTISVSEAERYIRQYFDRYAGVRAYMDRVVAEGRERGFVTTILGRRRLLPELASGNRRVAQGAERAAANTPIQGSAADLIKLAMAAVERRLAAESLQAAMILQVHDELVFEVATGDGEAASAVVKEEMEHVLPLAVALRVDIGVGKSWAEAH